MAEEENHIVSYGIKKKILNEEENGPWLKKEYSCLRFIWRLYVVVFKDVCTLWIEVKLLEKILDILLLRSNSPEFRNWNENKRS